MSKQYSDFSFAIDLVRDVYKTDNAIEIADRIEEDLGMEVSILQIDDYLHREENYEMESRRHEYNLNY